MKRSHVLFAILTVATASSFTSAQSSDGKNAPTVAEAQAFLDSANAELLKLTTDASHAEWTAETDITDDTEATTALMNEQATARALALGAESHRWDKVDLPPDLRRQILLLQLNTPAAPKDPKLLAEQTQLAAQLTATYGKANSAPTLPPGSSPRPAPSAWALTPSPTSWPNPTTLRNLPGSG
jgi:peptidyl-dipeptidase A